MAAARSRSSCVASAPSPTDSSHRVERVGRPDPAQASPHPSTPAPGSSPSSCRALRSTPSPFSGHPRDCRCPLHANPENCAVWRSSSPYRICAFSASVMRSNVVLTEPFSALFLMKVSLSVSPRYSDASASPRMAALNTFERFGHADAAARSPGRHDARIRFCVCWMVEAVVGAQRPGRQCSFEDGATREARLLRPGLPRIW